MSDGPGRDTPRPARRLTVALLREPPGEDFVEVAFYESARFYRLPRETPGFREALALLRRSQPEGHTVEVTFTSPHGDRIEAVREDRANPG